MENTPRTWPWVEQQLNSWVEKQRHLVETAGKTHINWLDLGQQLRPRLRATFLLHVQSYVIIIVVKILTVLLL